MVRKAASGLTLAMRRHKRIQKWISRKIDYLIHVERYPAGQAVAVAYSLARRRFRAGAPRRKRQ